MFSQYIANNKLKSGFEALILHVKAFNKTNGYTQQINIKLTTLTIVQTAT